MAGKLGIQAKASIKELFELYICHYNCTINGGGNVNAIRVKLKNNMFLTLIITTYIVLGILMPSKAVQSLNNSFYYIKEMLIIMPVILLLTSLIEAWVPKKSIEIANKSCPLRFQHL